jgi:hypothetical protein
MRGFASLLFLLTLSTLLFTIQQPHPYASTIHPAFDTLFLRRTEMENGIDTLIREELYAGLLLKLPPTIIKNKINQRIIAYLQDFPARHGEPIEYSAGVGILPYTNYHSLLLNPITPLHPSLLDDHSHVLVLPVTENVEYGEYTYTGGVNGTGVLVDILTNENHQTLFALPPGYRVCATNLMKEWPCPLHGGD